jgi:hypothetical protein
MKKRRPDQWITWKRLITPGFVTPGIRGRERVMTESNQIATEPFFLIVTDLDAGFFSVEGPLTDAAPWNLAAGRAREVGRSVQCGPSGPNRERLAAEYQQAHKLRGVPPRTILRPRG